MKEHPLKEEIEIKSLFDLITLTISKTFSFIKTSLFHVFKLLIRTYFLLKKNIILLLVCTFLSTAYPAYLYFKNGPQYESSFTIKLNYHQNNLVYDQINHFANLLENGRKNTLCKELSLDNEDNNNLSYISIKPVVSSIEKTELYNKYLTRVDTAKLTPIPFKEYITQLNDSDYKTHTITITASTIPFNFLSVQNSILNKIQSNPYIEDEKKATLNAISNRIKTAAFLQKKLDSILITENKSKLLPNQVPNTTGTSNYILNDPINEKSQKWIFNTYLDLQESINNEVKNKFIYSNSVRLLSSCTLGNKTGVKNTLIKHVLIGLFIGVLIALGRETNKYLSRFEKKHYK